METEYKPLFNRNYLKVLLLTCIFAVIWLSSLDGKIEWHAGHIEDSPVYWLEQKSAEVPTMQLLLATQGAISDAESDRQQLRKLIIEQRLTRQVPADIKFTVTAPDDHLNITFHGELEPERFSSLLSVLREPVSESKWQQDLERIKASRYLNQKKAEQQVLANYRNQLGNNHGPLPISWQRLFNNPRIVISGQDAEQLAEDLASTLTNTQQQTDARRSLPQLSGQYQIETDSDEAILLLGKTITPRTSQDFVEQRLLAETLQLALQTQPLSANSEFRLVWKSLLDSGYQALMIFSPKTLQPSQLQSFATNITAETVERAKQQLHQRWDSINENEQLQRAALSLLALYDLPLNTLELYGNELQTLDNDALLIKLRDTLDPASQYSVRTSPTHEES